MKSHNPKIKHRSGGKMKQPAVTPLIITATLVLTLLLGANAFALNFEVNEDQYPKDKSKWEEKKKATDQKKIDEQKAALGISQGPSPGMKCLENLSKEDAEKVKAERDRFLKATQDLRQEIMSKQLLIQSELVKPVTDVQKAITLQKELSALEADMDQKHLLHLLDIKKISPDAVSCMGMTRGDQGRGCPMKGK
jgi:hypothetical protein